MGVGQGFLGGEGLGRDDEESGGRIALLQRLGHMGAVDVGHEMHPQIGMPVRLQRLARHVGAEVGASYPDIHHVGDLPAVMPGPGAVADGLGEPAHLRQNPIDVGHDIAPIHHHRAVGAVAERRMQDRAVFRDVDPFAREHVVTPAGDILLAGKVEQQAYGFLGDAVLGVVEQEAVQTRRETGRPLRDRARTGRAYERFPTGRGERREPATRGNRSERTWRYFLSFFSRQPAE